jgi:hypothetical protein
MLLTAFTLHIYRIVIIDKKRLEEGEDVKFLRNAVTTYKPCSFTAQKTSVHIFTTVKT